MYTFGSLPLVVLRAQVVPYGRDERVQLCEECDRPHDVHGGGGENKSRAPDTINVISVRFQSSMYTMCAGAVNSLWRVAAVACDDDGAGAYEGGEGEHVRLVLPLGRQEPRRCAEDGRDHEADERCPAVFVSCVSLEDHKGARTRLPLCRCCMCGSGRRRLEVVLRRCGDAVACWELECDDACRGRAGMLGALVWMGDG